MELESVEGFVAGLLEYSAVYKDGEEADIYQALRHLLTGVALYDLMGEDDRQLTKKLLRKLQYFFSASFCVKERKRNKEKKNIPPNPLLKEKIKKEKAEKMCVCVRDAKEEFRKECLSYLNEYDQQLLKNFYYHWSEEDEDGKMLWQKQRHWNTKNRLEIWVNNQYSSETKAAAIRLKKAQKQQAKNATDDQQQRVVAEQREQADAQREAEREQDRQRAGGLDEQIAANPDGFLARVQRERQKREGKK